MPHILPFSPIPVTYRYNVLIKPSKSNAFSCQALSLTQMWGYWISTSKQCRLNHLHISSKHFWSLPWTSWIWTLFVNKTDKSIKPPFAAKLEISLITIEILMGQWQILEIHPMSDEISTKRYIWWSSDFEVGLNLRSENSFTATCNTLSTWRMILNIIRIAYSTSPLLTSIWFIWEII